MPTYEYFCTKCEHEFEISQSMSSPTLTICPKELCGLKRWGRGKVKKKIGAGAGLIFKGSGFYITDYRSEKYKEAAKKDSNAATPASSDSGSGKTSGGEGKASGSEGKTSGGEGKTSGSEGKAASAKTESKPAKPKAKE